MIIFKTQAREVMHTQKSAISVENWLLEFDNQVNVEACVNPISNEIKEALFALPPIGKYILLIISFNEKRSIVDIIKEIERSKLRKIDISKAISTFISAYVDVQMDHYFEKSDRPTSMQSMN